MVPPRAEHQREFGDELMLEADLASDPMSGEARDI